MGQRITIWLIVIVLACMAWGCPHKARKALKENPTILSMKPVKGYLKKVAVVQAPLPRAGLEQRTGDLFYNTLVASLKKDSKGMHLVASGDDNFPDFMAELSHATKAIDSETLSQTGRLNGYNGLITAALRHLRPVARKSGILWFRKTRYTLIFEVTLDLYDPFTGTKLLSILQDDSLKIEQQAYEEIKSGTANRIEALDKAVVDLAQDFGSQVIAAMNAQHWKASVVRVDGTQLELAAGSASGLREGQTLAVVKGNRILEGQQGEKFILPGVKIADIVITAVNEGTAQAKTDDTATIEAGDIVVPMR